MAKRVSHLGGRITFASFSVNVCTNTLYLLVYFLQRNALGVHKVHAGHMSRATPRGLQVVKMQCLTRLIIPVVFLLEPQQQQHQRWF